MDDKLRHVSLKKELEKDTPELAALLRQGMRSRHTLHKKGDIRKILARVRSRLGK